MFDTKKFQKTKFIHRTKQVLVPDLVHFFDEGDQALWEVRGLEFNEISVCNNQVGSQDAIKALLQALGNKQADADETTQAIQSALQINTEDPTDETKRRVQHLIIGSVNPQIDYDIANKLAASFPIVFKQLTDEILTLSGQGQDMEKPMPSGKTAE